LLNWGGRDPRTDYKGICETTSTDFPEKENIDAAAMNTRFNGNDSGIYRVIFETFLRQRLASVEAVSACTG
jgi:hypothetical protein